MQEEFDSWNGGNSSETIANDHRNGMTFYHICNSKFSGKQNNEKTLSNQL